MISKILLENVKIHAFHGVLPEEKIIGTYFIVNLTLYADLWKASATDDLKDTVNYADINDILHEEMKIPSQLLEHVAGRIMDRIEREFPQVSQITIKITKTNPPMQGEMRGVSVAFEKHFS